MVLYANKAVYKLKMKKTKKFSRKKRKISKKHEYIG